eukprot:SAG22_NODE_191_length_15699_cov_19.660192_5_plen_88_part_00
MCYQLLSIDGFRWYDDAESSDAKIAAVHTAGWRGVGFWQASGMWPGDTAYTDPFDNTTNIGRYCKREITALWATVSKYFGQEDDEGE